MKYIVNTTDELLLIEGMTVPPKARVPVINKEMLSWPDARTLLDQGKIRIVDPDEESSSTEARS